MSELQEEIEKRDVLILALCSEGWTKRKLAMEKSESTGDGLLASLWVEAHKQRGIANEAIKKLNQGGQHDQEALEDLRKAMGMIEAQLTMACLFVQPPKREKEQRRNS